MDTIVSMNPFRCRMWSLHNRLESYLTEESCKAEIESFLKHGQLVPVLGRRLAGDPDHDVELIYGARRLFVARHVNAQLLIQLRQMTDREAIIAMDVENRLRLDISPYERALSYARLLRTGQFDTQEDLARSVGVSASQVSRFLKLARIPSVIVNAFESPFEICEGWGLDLIDALDDPKRREGTVCAARAISRRTPRPPARDVYQELLAAAANVRRLKANSHCDEVVKDVAGKPLFRIKRQTSSIAVLLPLDSISLKSLERIRHAVTCILQDSKSQESDSPRVLDAASPSMLCSTDDRGVAAVRLLPSIPSLV